MEAKYLVLLSIIVTIVVCEHVKESGIVKEHVVRREKRVVGLTPELQQAYLDVLQQDVIQQRPTTTPQSTAGWEDYAPSIPEGNEITCYMNVFTMERNPGRCIRFGLNVGPYVCQSGMHYEAQDECERIIRQRHLAK